MRRIILLLAFFIIAFNSISAAMSDDDAKEYLKGCEIYSDEPTPVFLGIIEGKHELDSIFNRHGTYGNENSVYSIWNDRGLYGNKYSLFSARNKRTLTPPYIVKDGVRVGRLTRNKSLKDGISPYLVMELFDD